MENKKENKFKESIRFLKFAIISASAGIIQSGSFTVLELLECKYTVSYLVSLLLSILWNFTINRKITFKAANDIKIAMLLVLLFYAVFTPVSLYLGNLATAKGVNDFIVFVITMLSNFILEFFYTRYVVYRNSCDTAK